MESTVWICAVDTNHRQTRAYPVQCHGKRPSSDIALEFLKGIGCMPDFYRFYDCRSKLIIPPHALFEFHTQTKPRVYLTNELSADVDGPLLLFGNVGSFDGTYLSDKEFCDQVKKISCQELQVLDSQGPQRVDEKPVVSFFDTDQTSTDQSNNHQKPTDPQPSIQPPPVQFTFF